MRTTARARVTAAVSLGGAEAWPPAPWAVTRKVA
jgi:hypothetical protein